MYNYTSNKSTTAQLRIKISIMWSTAYNNNSLAVYGLGRFAVHLFYVATYSWYLHNNTQIL